MSNITTFELIVGIASILSLFITVGTYAIKQWRSFKQKRENAEQEFKRAVERLKSAGETVAARTDLGFFALIELGSLRDICSFYRHASTFFVISALFMLIFASIFAEMKNTTVSDVACVFGVIAIGLFIMTHNLANQYNKYVKLYERRIKDVWRMPIEKRLPSQE